MDVTERRGGDRAELGRRVGSEKNAKQRDRYRAAALAIDGRETQAIAELLGRSRRFVQRWAYAYRDGGIAAITVKKQSGRPPKLTLEQEKQLAERLEAGPRQDDGVCTLRGKDIVNILKSEFGKPYTLSGVYDLLHRLGFSSLSPRPRHRKNDPAAMQQFKIDAPLLSRTSASFTRTKLSKSGARTKPGSASRAR
jgi:transposase